MRQAKDPAEKKESVEGTGPFDRKKGKRGSQVNETLGKKVGAGSRDLRKMIRVNFCEELGKKGRSKRSEGRGVIRKIIKKESTQTDKAKSIIQDLQLVKGGERLEGARKRCDLLP